MGTMSTLQINFHTADTMNQTQPLIKNAWSEDSYDVELKKGARTTKAPNAPKCNSAPKCKWQCVNKKCMLVLFGVVLAIAAAVAGGVGIVLGVRAMRQLHGRVQDLEGRVHDLEEKSVEFQRAMPSHGVTPKRVV